MVKNIDIEQQPLIPPPYRYIIDTSSILSQKSGELYRRNVYRTLWENIELLMRSKEIVVCSEIKDEIEDKEILLWLRKNKCEILEPDYEIQRLVTKIVNEFPQLLDFAKVKSSGDAFIIATAIKYRIAVITEESKNTYKKIPKVCKEYNIPCYNLTELSDKEGWTF